MNVKELIAKLSKPYWMDTDPRTVFLNITPDHLGQLNILWVLTGRKQLKAGFFDNVLNTWTLAGAICNQKIDNYWVRDYATILTEQEFRKLVIKHPEVFSKYAPTLKKKLRATA